MAKRIEKKNTKPKHKHLLALLTPFLLHVTVGVGPLAAQMIESSGDVSPTPGDSPWNAGTVLYVGNNSDGSLTIRNGGRVSHTSHAYIGYNANAAGTASVTGTDSLWTIGHNLFVGYDGSAELTITNGGTITVSSGSLIGNNTGSTGKVTVDGTGSTWNSGVSTIGSDGTGELTIINGGTVNSRGSGIGYSASGKVTVDGVGSTWNDIGSIGTNIGSNGSGELIIINGGQVHCTTSHIGYSGIASGTVTVDGAGSIWTNTGDLEVGHEGYGELHIINGGKVTSANGRIGYDSYYIYSGTGIVTVDGTNSIWENTSALTVGGKGSGELHITNGGNVTNTSGYIGYDAGSTGTVTVDGPDSAWDNSVHLYVGYEGYGELTITNGGNVTNRGGDIGYYDHSIGKVTVDGTGSTWTCSERITLGIYSGSSGELHITNGGKVTSTNGDIGRTATGTVTVDGIGSTWDLSDPHSDLYVGNFGTGSLAITNGGQVNSYHGHIGSKTDSTGSVTVDGPDSTWINGGRLSIGEYGTGSLTITNGGKINSYGGVIGDDEGSTGTVLVDGAGSTWNNTSISVGRFGNGKLTITNGGNVTGTDSVVIGFEYRTTGTVIVDGVGSSLICPGSTPYSGLYVGYGGTSELTISNGAVVTTNKTLIANGGGEGTLTIGAATGETPVAPGTLYAEMLVFGGGGTSHLVFNHNDNTGNYTFTPVIIGGYERAGSSVDFYAGTTVFTGDGSDYDYDYGYTAPTTIHGGTLATGQANVLSKKSLYDIKNAGTLALRGYNQTVGNITNAGLINMRGSAPGTILTITGDYIGNGGTIAMNTKLNDDASPTDRIIIDGGSASGNTYLQIINTGGLGAQTTGNGILLVGTANGGTTALDAFALHGQVKAGAFEYLLFRGGVDDDADTDDWYLRSVGGGTRPEIPGYLVVPVLAFRAGQVGTYFDRVGSYYGSAGKISQGLGREDNGSTPSNTQPGENQASDSQYAHLLWGRIVGETGRGGSSSGGDDIGKRGNFGFGKDGPKYSYTYGGIQIGADLYRTEKDTLGLYFGASTLRSNVKDTDGSHAGRVNMDALSLGGYWTHQDPTGWYTDLVLQGTWYTSIRSHAQSGEDFSTSGMSLTMSAEAGYVIDLGTVLGESWANGLSMIPQIQFAYQYANIQNGCDNFGQIQYNSTNAFYGRLGNRLTKTWSSTGMSAWVEANLWHQFDSTAKTTFRALDGSNPTTISSRLGDTWAQVVIGVSVPLTKNVCVFSTADYNIGLGQSSHSFGGQVGVQVSW